jgi:hypothetical protein
VASWASGKTDYPLLWSLLTYPRLEGYEVNMSDEQLQGAPKYGTSENWRTSRSRAVDDYYDIQPGWMF